MIRAILSPHSPAPVQCPVNQDSYGMSLLEVVITLGVSAVIALLLGQTLVDNQLRIKKFNEAVAIQDLNTSILSGFNGRIGDKMLKSWAPGQSLPSTWPTAHDMRLALRPSFNLTAHQCPRSGHLYLGLLESTPWKIPVDVLSINSPVAVKGQRLPRAPAMQVNDMYLIQLGDYQNRCPEIQQCREGSTCSFKLVVKLQRELNGESFGPSQELSYLLYCRTKSVSSTQEAIESCKLVGASESLCTCGNYSAFISAWEQGLMTADCNKDGGIDGRDTEAYDRACRSGCVGDLNQDGYVDGYDLEYITTVWGPAPLPLGTPESPWGMQYSAVVPPNEDPELISWVFAPDGDFPNPAPTPAYSTSFISAVSRMIKLGDVVHDGAIDGGDLGSILNHFGCVSQSQVCFEEAGFYPLIQRAAGFAQPDDVLNEKDLEALNTCASVTLGGDRELADDPRCLGMNLDGRCELPQSSLAVPGLGATPRYCRRSDGSSLTQWMVVGRSDQKTLEYLLRMQGLISRYRKTKPDGTSCTIRSDP